MKDTIDAQLETSLLGDIEQCPFCLQYFELWLEYRCSGCDRQGCYFCIAEENRTCPECLEEPEKEGEA